MVKIKLGKFSREKAQQRRTNESGGSTSAEPVQHEQVLLPHEQNEILDNAHDLIPIREPPEPIVLENPDAARNYYRNVLPSLLACIQANRIFKNDSQGTNNPNSQDQNSSINRETIPEASASPDVILAYPFLQNDQVQSVLNMQNSDSTDITAPGVSNASNEMDINTLAISPSHQSIVEQIILLQEIVPTISTNTEIQIPSEELAGPSAPAIPVLMELGSVGCQQPLNSADQNPSDTGSVSNMMILDDNQIATENYFNELAREGSAETLTTTEENIYISPPQSSVETVPQTIIEDHTQVQKFTEEQSRRDISEVSYAMKIDPSIYSQPSACIKQDQPTAEAVTEIIYSNNSEDQEPSEEWTSSPSTPMAVDISKSQPAVISKKKVSLPSEKDKKNKISNKDKVAKFSKETNRSQASDTSISVEADINNYPRPPSNTEQYLLPYEPAPEIMILGNFQNQRSLTENIESVVPAAVEVDTSAPPPLQSCGEQPVSLCLDSLPEAIILNYDQAQVMPIAFTSANKLEDLVVTDVQIQSNEKPVSLSNESVLKTFGVNKEDLSLFSPTQFNQEQFPLLHTPTNETTVLALTQIQECSEEGRSVLDSTAVVNENPADAAPPGSSLEQPPISSTPVQPTINISVINIQRLIEPEELRTTSAVNVEQGVCSLPHSGHEEYQLPSEQISVLDNTQIQNYPEEMTGQGLPMTSKYSIEQVSLPSNVVPQTIIMDNLRSQNTSEEFPTPGIPEVSGAMETDSSPYLPPEAPLDCTTTTGITSFNNTQVQKSCEQLMRRGEEKDTEGDSTTIPTSESQPASDNSAVRSSPIEINERNLQEHLVVTAELPTISSPEFLLDTSQLSDFDDEVHVISDSDDSQDRNYTDELNVDRCKDSEGNERNVAETEKSLVKKCLASGVSDLQVLVLDNSKVNKSTEQTSKPVKSKPSLVAEVQVYNFQPSLPESHSYTLPGGETSQVTYSVESDVNSSAELTVAGSSSATAEEMFSVPGPSQLPGEEDLFLSDPVVEIKTEPMDYEYEDGPIAHRLPRKRRRTMALPTIEIRKSSRIKRKPDRLFYIGKGLQF